MSRLPLTQPVATPTSRASGAPERPLFWPAPLEAPAELQSELGHRRVLPCPSSSSCSRLAGVVQAHSDALVPKQNLQVLDTRTLGFEVFLREPVAQAVRSEPAPFNSGPSRDALDNLAYAVHREGMISAPTMGAAAEEQSFRAHALRALVHQVLEHGALGLGM